MADVTGDHDPDRVGEVERDVKILRKVIQGAERKDAKRSRRIHDRRRDAADRAVAARSHDNRRAGARITGQRGRILAAFERDDFRCGAGGAKQIGELDLDALPFRGGAGRRVDDDDDRRRGGHSLQVES